uniref:Uncharacterized protein n=1 Tax=Fagus sylvatica TaxID=28930 RepID=A0A2N9EK42_FAGSY
MPEAAISFHHWVYSLKNLIALFLHPLKIEPVRSYLGVEPVLEPGRYPPAPSNEKSSSTVSTIRLHSLSGYLEMSESATAHCRRMVPSSGSTFAGHTGEICVSKGLKPRVEPGPFLLSHRSYHPIGNLSPQVLVALVALATGPC